VARSVRHNPLESRSNRLKLPKVKSSFVTIGENLSLGYRRPLQGSGAWQARLWTGERYVKYTLGEADDHMDANGDSVLTFFQAQNKARLFAEAAKFPTPTAKPLTAADASERYMAWYKEHRKSYAETKATVDAHILPQFGDKLIATLSTREIREWHQKLATKPARKRARAGAKPAHREEPVTAEQKRARKSTANRILTVLKAILNKAFHDELVADDTVWRRVKPFPNADEPVTRFLTEAESTRLINASPEDLRQLIKAALFTGARYGELTRLKAGDVNLDTEMIYITPEAKSGKGRFIPLSHDGLDFFNTLTVGRARDTHVFTRADGRPWGKNHHVRLLQAACETGKIEPAIGFHELRHTYASTLAQSGVDLLTISKLLGHADTRITSRHYAHLCDQTLREAVKKLPSFGHVPDQKLRSIR